MELLGDKGHVDLTCFSLEIVLVLVQDWCAVCSICTIGSEIAYPMVVLGDEAQVKASIRSIYR
jgi:hypothetical protein